MFRRAYPEEKTIPWSFKYSEYSNVKAILANPENPNINQVRYLLENGELVNTNNIKGFDHKNYIKKTKIPEVIYFNEDEMPDLIYHKVDNNEKTDRLVILDVLNNCLLFRNKHNCIPEGGINDWERFKSNNGNWCYVVPKGTVLYQTYIPNWTIEDTFKNVTSTNENSRLAIYEPSEKCLLFQKKKYYVPDGANNWDTKESSNGNFCYIIPINTTLQIFS